MSDENIMDVTTIVTLKDFVFDAFGADLILEARSSGFLNIQSIKTGKCFELKLRNENRESAYKIAADMSAKLFINSSIEQIKEIIVK